MSESLPGRAPTPGSLAALSALGALGALWSLFLWGQLLMSRMGGTPFCGTESGSGCAGLWDSAFPSAVHRLTGLPLAGWGLVWGLAAFALPLLALAAQAQGRPAPVLVSAVRLAAAAGVAVVLVLVATSAIERAFCVGCFGAYLPAAGYAGIALFGWPPTGLPELRRGAALFAGAIVAGYGLLLYPGLRSPRGTEQAGREAIVLAAGSDVGRGATDRDHRLEEFLGSLTPELRQALSDSLDLYRRGPAPSSVAPRALLGSEEAPVRITEFTDVRCEHCAELHATLAALRDRLPPASFSVDARQFPLSGECNPLVRARGDPVRCLAAKAQICLEGRDGAFVFSGRLFENQKTLTPEDVFSLATPYMPRAALEACLASPSTRAKLDEDIAWASDFDPEGTPLVLVNGRRGTGFGPFLFAMVLSRGAESHPAFRALPAPSLTADLR